MYETLDDAYTAFINSGVFEWETCGEIEDVVKAMYTHDLSPEEAIYYVQEGEG